MLLNIGNERLIPLFMCKLIKLLGLLNFIFQCFPRINFCMQLVEILDYFLRTLTVIPEIRIAGLSLQGLYVFSRLLGVKDASRNPIFALSIH